jgi:hypothetical protein
VPTQEIIDTREIQQMLIRNIKPGDSQFVRLGDNVFIQVNALPGGRVSIKIEAPISLDILMPRPERGRPKLIEEADASEE